MKRLSWTILLAFIGSLAFGVLTSQAAITWTDFTNIDSDGNPNTGTFAPNTTLPTANIQSASLMVANPVGGVGPATGSSPRLALNSGGYGTTFTFTLTAESGGSLLSGLAFTIANYVAGHPTYVDWSYQIDSSAIQSLDPATTSWNANGGYQHTLTTPVSFSGGETLKLFGTLDNTGATTSPLWFNDLSLDVAPVPEPANVALGIFGVLGICVGTWKRYFKK